MASSYTFSTWGLCGAVVLSIASSSWPAEFAGGTGKPNDPYQIATARQLVSIGSDPNLLDKHFILVDDIDLDPNLPGGRVFTQAVIAADVFHTVGKKTVVDSLAFTGTFEGNSHTVKNLVIKDTRARSVGLFGTIGTSGRVQDLGVENSTTEGPYWVGGLAGHNGGTILRCYVLGQVIASQYSGGLVGRNRGVIAGSHATGAVLGGNKSEALGGLTGQNGDGGSITNCYSDTSVTAGHSSDYLGVLVGDNVGSISNSYATGTLSAEDSSMFVGGLAGYNTGSIANCYTVAPVLSGQASASVGGFVGNNPFGTVANCFATGRVEAGYASKNVGGFLGHAISVGDVIHCFWDMEASGMPFSEGGAGLTTSEMQNAQRYLAEGWDWVGEQTNGTADLWVIPEVGGYPQLVAFYDQAAGRVLKGSGTQNDPYRINAVEDIGTMSRYDPSARYRLDADLDMSGIVWTSAPIAGFDGVFEGADHVISNLKIRGGGHLGLFAILGSRATVRSLVIQDVTIVGLGPTYYLGALAGDNVGSIVDCHATGVVSGWNYVGGLVGSNHWGEIARSYAAVNVLSAGSYASGGFAGSNGGDITACFAIGSVSGVSKTQKVGGLVGYNTHLGHITNSYAHGSVSGGEGSSYLGGFVGHNEDLGLITNCYTIAVVSGGADSRNVGGFAGRSEVSTTVRGPGGAAEVTVSNCYFLGSPDIATPADSAGSPLMDDEMKRQSSFTGWDFDGVWMICEGKDYPRLRWERVQCPP